MSVRSPDSVQSPDAARSATSRALPALFGLLKVSGANETGEPTPSTVLRSAQSRALAAAAGPVRYTTQRPDRRHGYEVTTFPVSSACRASAASPASSSR